MKYLGFDLGASSGKMSEGILDNQILRMSVIHRFSNRQINLAGGLYWDIIHIYQNLELGLRLSASDKKERLFSIGIDAFCNDFGLIDHNGRLFNQVRCYRDERTRRQEARIYENVSARELYMRTGSQVALFNTSMQMASMVFEGEDFMLEHAEKALLIPDLLGYFLTGQMTTEYTLASVTQLMDYKTDAWAADLMGRLGIPADIFPSIVSTGTIKGEIQGQFLSGNAGSLPKVVAVPGHDTASAIAALPAVKEKVGYISSGTWSIVGTEVPVPKLTEETYRSNIAYEGGVDHRYRMIRNVMGLWIFQECMFDYEKIYGKKLSYDELNEMAEKAQELQYCIDPDDESFYMPGNMIEKVNAFCRRTGQGSIDSFGGIIRTVLESLALKYRMVFEQLEQINGYALEEIYILGGGAQNVLLDQFVANACQKQVFAGPVEAGLAGNIVVQMRSSGEIASLKEGRQIIRDSFEILEFEPKHAAKWNEQYGKFRRLLKKEEL